MLTLTRFRLTPELIQECERVISKTYPACVAFHKPSFIQQLKNASLDPALIYALLTCAARYVSAPGAVLLLFPIPVSSLPSRFTTSPRNVRDFCGWRGLPVGSLASAR